MQITDITSYSIFSEKYYLKFLLPLAIFEISFRVTLTLCGIIKLLEIDNVTFESIYFILYFCVDL